MLTTAGLPASCDGAWRQLFDAAIAGEQLQPISIVTINGAKIAFITVSYVIKPLFFPSGDIGKLAVCGALNDIDMSGAKPL